MSKSVITLLFVYGSLKTNFQFHHLMNGATFLSIAKTKKGYSLFKYDGFPCLVPITLKDRQRDAFEDTSVSGELYSIHSVDHLNTLDKFEGHPMDYMRLPVQVITDTDNIVNAETYVFLHPERLISENSFLIADGIWTSEHNNSSGFQNGAVSSWVQCQVDFELPTTS